MGMFIAGAEAGMVLLGLLCANRDIGVSRGKMKLFFCFSCGMLLSLFVGLRMPYIGTDMPAYIRGFYMAADAGWSEIWTLGIYNFERGFILFNKLLSLISANDQMLCIGCAMLSIMPFSYWIYKKSAYPLLSFVLLLGTPSFVWVYSALRQMGAIGICAFAMLAIQDKKPIRFIVSVLIAALFHYTAIIFMITYPVYWCRVRKKNRAISIILLIFIFFAKTPVFHILKFILNKGHYRSEVTGAYTLFAVYTCIYIMCWLLSKDDETQNGLLNVFFLSCMTQCFGNINMLASRTTYFYVISIVLLIPQMLSEYRTNDTRKIVYLGTLICFLLFAVIFTGHASMFHDIGGYFFWR